MIRSEHHEDLVRLVVMVCLILMTYAYLQRPNNILENALTPQQRVELRMEFISIFTD